MRNLRLLTLSSLLIAVFAIPIAVGQALSVLPPRVPGLPTPAQTAAAKRALADGVATITKFSGIHCVGPHFHLPTGQTRTGFLIANPGQLECNILADTNYHITVVTSSPKPFYNGHEGQISATFAPQVGFILLYTTAGKLGIPYSRELKISKTQ